MFIALRVRARKCGTDAMLAFMSPPWQSYLLTQETKVERSHDVSLIVPRLYVTNLCSAQSEAKLKEYGVTHVVSVLEEKPKFPHGVKLKKLHIPVPDSYYSPLLQHLDTTTAFIKDALEENETNVVMIHCVLGISRSATVAVAYVTATTNMRPTEALDFVASKRTITCPNAGFRRQIERYGLKLYAASLRADLEAKRERRRLAREARELRALSSGSGTTGKVGRARKFPALGCFPSKEDVVHDDEREAGEVEVLTEGQAQPENGVALEEMLAALLETAPQSEASGPEIGENTVKVEEVSESEVVEMPVVAVVQVSRVDGPGSQESTSFPIHAL